MKALFEKRSLIGFIIKIIGLVIIGWGFLQGLIISAQFSQHGMDEWGMGGSGGSGLSSFLAIFFVNAVYGVLVIGFGEVIDLLQRIHDQNGPGKPIASTVPASASVGSIPFDVEVGIKAFYTKMNLEIEEVLPTKHRDVFIVKVADRTEYIEIGGLSPQLLSEKEAEKYL